MLFSVFIPVLLVVTTALYIAHYVRGRRRDPLEQAEEALTGHLGNDLAIRAMEEANGSGITPTAAKGIARVLIGMRHGNNIGGG